MRFVSKLGTLIIWMAVTTAAMSSQAGHAELKSQLQSALQSAETQEESQLKHVTMGILQTEKDAKRIAQVL